jgi:hypothetical protein
MPEKLSPKELNRLARLGRNGDTELAHVNPQEKAMLKAMGGSGTINPYTGLREYGFLGDLWKGIKGLGQGVYDMFIPSGRPGTSVWEAVLGGDDWFAEDPVPKRRVEELDASDVLKDSQKKLKAEQYRKSLKPSSGAFGGGAGGGGGNLSASGTPRATSPEWWKWNLESPWITENVEKFSHGGSVETIAEFTGDELIVQQQDQVEAGIATGNYAMAAEPIRNALTKGAITPGPSDHKENPLSVQDDGMIYNRGGKSVGIKVTKGAGIYDNASKQFNPFMTDKQITESAKKNINKWKENNMY